MLSNILKIFSVFCFVQLVSLTCFADAPIYVYRERNGVLRFTDRAPASSVKSIIFQPRTHFVSRIKFSYKNNNNKLLQHAKYSSLIENAAFKHQLDRALIQAVIHAESGFNPHAVSPKGARGLMQLMPGTAKRFGVNNAFSPELNIRAGSQYLRTLLNRYRGRTDLALAAYNAGEGAVERHKGIPPYPETREYVRRVLQLKKRYSAPVHG